MMRPRFCAIMIFATARTQRNDRIAALEAARDTLGLDAESKRVLWRYHRDFVRAGAKLGAAGRQIETVVGLGYRFVE